MNSADLSNRFDKTIGFARFIEDKLTAGNAATPVIRRIGNKKAGVSRHWTPAMRGLDFWVLTDLPPESMKR